MKISAIISIGIGTSMLFGCVSSGPSGGPNGPELVSSGYSNENGSYAEVGVQFTTAGDFFALVSPSRWRNPVATGGSLSWMNPNAWSEDAGRTGRVLLGEAAIVGGVAIAAAAGGGGSGDSSPPPPTGGPPPGP